MMMSKIRSQDAFAQGDEDMLQAYNEGQDSLLRVYAEARRYIHCRDRHQQMERLGQAGPRDLAEAIERDFVAFELEGAERSLRAALRGADVALGQSLSPR